MEWAVFIIGLALAVVAIVTIIYFLVRRPVSPRQTQQPLTADPAALRRERLERAKQRRVELERRVEEEGTLLFEEEERDFLRQELNELRQTRRQRRQPQGQQNP